CRLRRHDAVRHHSVGFQPLGWPHQLAPPHTSPPYCSPKLPQFNVILGFERAAGQREVFLVEGAFDWLTAVSWNLPAFSTCGTDFPADRLGWLARARVIFGVLDADRGGREAAERFGSVLGRRWVPLE